MINHGAPETVVVPVTITDELPAGLALAPGVSGEDELGVKQNTAGHNFSKDCEAAGEEQKVSCTYGGVVQPGDTLLLRFPVGVSGTPPPAPWPAPCEAVPMTALSCVTNVVRVSGGGVSRAAMRTPTDIYGANRRPPKRRRSVSRRVVRRPRCRACRRARTPI